MIAFWRCWPLVKQIARHGIKHHHPIGHAHRIVRHVVKHKIAWTCVAVLGGGASIGGLAWPEMVPAESGTGFGIVAPPVPGGLGTVVPAPGSLGPVGEFLPPEAIAELPPGSLPPQTEIETQPIPQGPVQRVPEPGSIWLLASGLAAFVLIGWRRA